jgi:hypothetical protein
VNTFVVITTLLGIAVAAASVLVPWRLWIFDKREKVKEKGDVVAKSEHISISFFSESETQDILFAFKKIRKKESFLAPFPIQVANTGGEQARDVLLIVTIPEAIFPAWREGEFTYDGPADVFDVRHHHELVEGKKVVRITMRIGFINPHSAFVLALELLVRGNTLLRSVTPVTTKDKVRLRIPWQVQYSYKITATANSSAGNMTRRTCSLHVLEYPDKGDPDYHIAHSDVFKGLAKKNTDSSTPVTLVQFDNREAVSRPNSSARDQVVKLTKPLVRLASGGALIASKKIDLDSHDTPPQPTG